MMYLYSPMVDLLIKIICTLLNNIRQKKLKSYQRVIQYYVPNMLLKSGLLNCLISNYNVGYEGRENERGR